MLIEKSRYAFRCFETNDATIELSKIGLYYTKDVADTCNFFVDSETTIVSTGASVVRSHII